MLTNDIIVHSDWHWHLSADRQAHFLITRTTPLRCVVLVIPCWGVQSICLRLRCSGHFCFHPHSSRFTLTPTLTLTLTPVCRQAGSPPDYSHNSTALRCARDPMLGSSIQMPTQLRCSGHFCFHPHSSTRCLDSSENKNARLTPGIWFAEREGFEPNSPICSISVIYENSFR